MKHVISLCGALRPVRSLVPTSPTTAAATARYIEYPRRPLNKLMVALLVVAIVSQIL